MEDHPAKRRRIEEPAEAAQAREQLLAALRKAERQTIDQVRQYYEERNAPPPQEEL